MSTVILSCTTLEDYVDAAQKACNTDYPVYYLNKKYHVEPKDMRAQVLKAIDEMPDDVDTVLVSMGFCGGSWQDVVPSKRIVIPRVDDCVSLVMTTSDEVVPNKKQMGHMYVFGGESEGFSIGGIYDSTIEKYGEKKGKIIFDMMFECYGYVDIVETGIFDCYDLEFVETVQVDADRMNAEINYVPGSNLLLEKLFSGSWDDQFMIVEPGEKITQGAFFEV